MRRDELRAILQGAGIHPKRSAGQNFLVEENLAQAIAREGKIESGDVVLEIGPGFGMLTQFLAPLAHRILAVDLDARLLALARERLSEHDNLTLLEADALATKNRLNPVMIEALRTLLEDRPLRVVANLPYNVATPLVIGLLSERLPLRSMTVMVQLEVAQRFGASRGDEQYGAVSVLCRALCDEVSLLRKVPRDVFMPRPKVTSAVVRLIPAEDRHDGFEILSAVVRALFNYRRKTLTKAVKAATRRAPELAWLSEALEASDIDPMTRPDGLGLEGYLALVRFRRNGLVT